MKITKATTKVELTREEAEAILSRVQTLYSELIEASGEDLDYFEENWTSFWTGRNYGYDVPDFRNELTVTICG